MRPGWTALITLVLTVPVFLLLTQIAAIPEWLYSENGYTLLRPLFVMLGAFGVEGYENVVTGVLFAGSFVLAVAIVVVMGGLWRVGRGIDR